ESAAARRRRTSSSQDLAEFAQGDQSVLRLPLDTVFFIRTADDVVIAILIGLASGSRRQKTGGNRTVNKIEDSLDRSARLVVDGNPNHPVPAGFSTVKEPRLIGDLSQQYFCGLCVKHRLQDFSFSDELDRLRR